MTSSVHMIGSVSSSNVVFQCVEEIDKNYAIVQPTLGRGIDIVAASPRHRVMASTARKTRRKRTQTCQQFPKYIIKTDLRPSKP